MFKRICQFINRISHRNDLIYHQYQEFHTKKCTRTNETHQCYARGDGIGRLYLCKEDRPNRSSMPHVEMISLSMYPFEERPRASTW